VRALFGIASVELRRRMRNRSALITAIVAPLAMAVVFGLLVGGGASFQATIGVADEDASELSASFVEDLLDIDEDAITFVATDPGAARSAVDDGELDAAIVIPDGFGEQATAGQGGAIEVVRDPRNEISAAVARSIAGEFADGISTRALAAVTLVGITGTAPPADALAGLDETAARMSEQAPGGRPLDAAAYFGASMSILFLFFTVAFAAQSLVAERSSGVLGRVLATGATPRAVVGGKVLAVCLLGLGSFVVVWLVTTLGFGARWGNTPAVLVTMLATVVAVGGVAMFVAGLASTPRQAESYASATAFVLALLGGNFLGPGQAPPLLEQLSRYTPNGQSLRAFTAVATDGAGIADIAPNLAALVTIGVVFGAIGMIRSMRAVQR
jgi:ABC-2 type transport system permease protein